MDSTVRRPHAAGESGALKGGPAGGGGYAIAVVCSAGDLPVGAQVDGEPRLVVVGKPDENRSGVRTHITAQEGQEGHFAVIVQVEGKLLGVYLHYVVGGGGEGGVTQIFREKT